MIKKVLLVSLPLLMANVCVLAAILRPEKTWVFIFFAVTNVISAILRVFRHEENEP